MQVLGDLLDSLDAARRLQAQLNFNLFEIGGSPVVIDYGHNPSALLALISACEKCGPELCLQLVEVGADVNVQAGL